MRTIGRLGIATALALSAVLATAAAVPAAPERWVEDHAAFLSEDRLPDATAARIIRDVIGPRVHSGDRDGAVTAGVDAVLAAIEGGPWQDPATASSATGGTHGAAGTTWADWLVLGAIAIAILVAFRRHPWLAMTLWNAGSHGRGGGGHGSRSHATATSARSTST